MPLEGVSEIALIAGVVVSIWGPDCVSPPSDRLAALPLPSVMVAQLRLTAVTASDGGSLAGSDRVAEFQRTGARTPSIGRGAAVIQRQCRCAARTVTTSLILTVSVTTLPTPRSPEPAVTPVPEATTEDTEGVVVSICSVPARLPTAPVRLAAVPAPFEPSPN